MDEMLTEPYFSMGFLGCFEGKNYGIEVEEKAFLELRKLAKSAAFRSTDAR